MTEECRQAQSDELQLVQILTGSFQQEANQTHQEQYSNLPEQVEDQKYSLVENGEPKTILLVVEGCRE